MAVRITKTKLWQKIENKLGWYWRRKLPPLQAQLHYYWLVIFNSRPMKVSPTSTLIIAPHPDDEVLGCGGLIALKRDLGMAVNVIFITDGGASHGWHSRYKSDEIVAIRQQEALNALSILGVNESSVHFLNRQDGKLKYVSDTYRQEIIEQLTALIRSINPTEVYVTHYKDRNADHEATCEMTKAAIAASELNLELFQYPISLFWKTLLLRDVKLSELKGAYRLSISAVLKKKQQAIEAYPSQYLPIDEKSGTALPYGFMERFLVPYEVFFRRNDP